MEDLDPPREEPGAAQSILDSLQRHGLHWDESVMWQGQRHPAYADALERLRALGCLFRCDCTRAMLGPDGACGGRCLPRQEEVGPVAAVRVKVPFDCTVEFEDRLQGRQSHLLGREWPDFVLRRKDGLDAYQLAVVVDDAAQGVTHIVRGSDLIDSTPRQLFLQQLLGFPTPDYCHLPVITNALGQTTRGQSRTCATRWHSCSRRNHQPGCKAVARCWSMPWPTGNLTGFRELWPSRRRPPGCELYHPATLA